MGPNFAFSARNDRNDWIGLDGRGGNLFTAPLIAFVFLLYVSVSLENSEDLYINSDFRAKHIFCHTVTFKTTECYF